MPLTSDGKIVARLTRLAEKKLTEKNPFDGEIPPEFSECSAIYLSSFEDSRLRFFYNSLCPELPVVPLTNGNLPRAVSRGEGSLLLYAADVFPDCRKMDIAKAVERFAAYGLEEMERKTVIKREWASAGQGDRTNLAKFIAFFDEGYRAVMIEDDDGRFVGSVTPTLLWHTFPSRDIRFVDTLSIPYTEDESELVKSAVRTFSGTFYEEVPAVRDGKVVSTLVRVTSHGLSRVDIRRNQPLRWDYIGDEVLRDFLGDAREIMISSRKGSLAGFYERLSPLADVTVFDDSMIERLTTGGFDMAIWGTPYYIPGFGAVPRYSAMRLYARLLLEEMMREFRKRGIGYHILYSRDPDTAETLGEQLVTPPDAAMSARYRINRSTKNKKITQPAVITAGKRNTWYGFSDSYEGSVANFSGGRRMTVGNPKKFTNTVYFIGNCLAWGFAVKDSETVESFLQERINEARIPCRVVNMGSSGHRIDDIAEDIINHFYQIIDLKLVPGDVIIHSTGNIPFEDGIRGIGKIPGKIYHRLRDAFDGSLQYAKKIFVDRYAAHLTTEGTKITADYIFEMIRDELPKSRVEAFYLFPGSADKKPQAKYEASAGIRGYIEWLRQFRVDAGRIGCVVVNANPFTKGHMYLVDTARKAVDFLYVFVVEEDASEVSFSDRLAIVEANCAKYDNVKVVTTGKHLATRETFGAYFNRASLQKQKVNIAYDIHICGLYVFPCLGITYRFFGEEPTDTVMQQYNQAMKDIFPGYGITPVEIPRLKSDDGGVVSASRVRRLIREGCLAECRPYLTDETYEYIAAHIENFLRP